MARQRGHSIAEEVRIFQLGREQWEELIVRWLNNERDRYIISRHVLDGATYNKINNELEAMGEYPLSDRRLSQIIGRGIDTIAKHVKDVH